MNTLLHSVTSSGDTEPLGPSYELTTEELDAIAGAGWWSRLVKKFEQLVGEGDGKPFPVIEK